MARGRVQASSVSLDPRHEGSTQSAMELGVLVTPGLGDNSYLVASGGEAAVIDPQRDVARLLTIAESRDEKIRHVLETHVHNDYVSGALEIREATGAEIAAAARGGYEFEHRPMAEGDEITVGELALVAMETPGHTPEHLSYLLKEAGYERCSGVWPGVSIATNASSPTVNSSPSAIGRCSNS